MKQIFRKIGLGLAILLAMPLASYAKNRYQSDLLAQIAESLQIKNVLDTMSNGSYIAQRTYKSHPLSIIVEDGEVEHIGYTLFSKEMRIGMPSPVYNFWNDMRYRLTCRLRELSRWSVSCLRTRLHSQWATFTSCRMYVLWTMCAFRWIIYRTACVVSHGRRMAVRCARCVSR